MSWAARRRFIILLIIGAIAVAFLVVVSIASFYKTPSCTDRTQNQGEDGIDCGGPCSYLCREQQQPPTVLFTKAIKNGEERVDVIALIENKNPNAAAKDVPYTITLYGTGQALVQKVTGTLDLPPHASVPVFVPGISSGKQKVVNAFLNIDASAPRWFSMPVDTRIVPTVFNTIQSGATTTPRIEAILTNPGLVSINNVQAIVLVHNDKKEVIAASATIVPIIQAHGQATATFSWNEPFSSIPAVIEVMPIIPLL